MRSIERLRSSPIAPVDSLRRRGSIGGVPDKQTGPTTGSRRPLQPQQSVFFASLSRQRFPGFPRVLNASVARRYRPETARDDAVRSGASRSCSYCPQTSSGAQRFKSDTLKGTAQHFFVGNKTAAARPLRLPGHLAYRHRSIERVRETLIQYSNVIRGLAVAELSYIEEEQLSISSCETKPPSAIDFFRQPEQTGNCPGFLESWTPPRLADSARRQPALCCGPTGSLGPQG